jgi:hypothetical protein
VKRHIMADAAGVSEFTSPVYVGNTVGLSSGGALDSFSSGLSRATGCTGHGDIGMSDGNNINFGGGGGGLVNCAGVAAIDHCIVFGNHLPPYSATASCPPPPASYLTGTNFPVPKVYAPTAGVDYPSSGAPGLAWACNSASRNSPSALKAGKVYYYTTVSLLDGCGIDPGTLPSTAPVVIFAKNLIIGAHTGSGSSHALVNASSASTCPVATTGWAYTSRPLDYCSGWSSKLQIFIPNGISGTVTAYGNTTSFWGVVNAPDASMSIGDPQFQMWGSMVLGSLAATAQFNWHYDVANADIILAGTFQIVNWREEPS